MKARLRTCLAAFVCFAAGSPALAQQAPSNTVVPAQNGVVGPAQLQNFSINGTVTRPAPAPSQPPPVTREPPAATARPDQPSSAPSRRVEPAPARQAPRTRLTEQPTVEAAPPPAVSEPSPALTDSIPTTEVPATVKPVATSSSRVPMLPWIVAALALAGAAAWFVLRRKRRESFADTGSAELFDLSPAPAPEPPAAIPPAAPAPTAPVPGGIVSARLRPWLELELNPDRGVVDDEKAAVAFELSVYNSGSVPARDVILEATLFNAGPSQDQQIQLFFDKPVGRGDPIPAIPPLQRVTVNTAVFIARDKLQPIQVEGRSLFVPMIAVNALYSWGASKGQTSGSYLVGKETSGEKLAPFRTDLGRRIFRGLAAREHALKVRK